MYTYWKHLHKFKIILWFCIFSQIFVLRRACTSLQEKTLCRTFLPMTSQTQPARLLSSMTSSFPSGQTNTFMTKHTAKFTNKWSINIFLCLSVMQRRSWGWRCVLQTQWLCPSWLLLLHEMDCLTTWNLKVKDLMRLCYKFIVAHLIFTGID